MPEGNKRPTYFEAMQEVDNDFDSFEAMVEAQRAQAQSGSRETSKTGESFFSICDGNANGVGICPSQFLDSKKNK